MSTNLNNINFDTIENNSTNGTLLNDTNAQLKFVAQVNGKNVTQAYSSTFLVEEHLKKLPEDVQQKAVIVPVTQNGLQFLKG